LFAPSSRAARFTVSPIDVKSILVFAPTEPKTTRPVLIPIPIEITFNGEKFGRKTLYIVMIKILAPIFLFVILLTGLGLI
jgi:hypothetical protein